MLSFLNSVVLPALLAAAIPLIIHFFNRKKAKKISFSSLRFLKLLENQRIKQIRLYQILLILIRILFIVFLVLAFARPTLKSGFFNSGGNARTTAVVILDDSYSMQAYHQSQTYFEIALSDFEKITATFQSNDQLFVITPSTVNDTPESINPGSDNQLESYSVTNKSPDFGAALVKARRIFEANPNFNNELYILSDLRISKKAIEDSLAGYFENFSGIVYLAGPESNGTFSNLSIDTVIIQNRLFEPQKPIHFSVRIKNHDTGTARESTLNLYNSSNRLAMADVLIPAAGQKEIDLSFVPQTTGFHLLQFELNEDALLADNYHYLNIYLAEAVNVLFVENNIRDQLKSALDVLAGQTILDIDISDFLRWNGKNLDQYDLIVLSDPPALSDESRQRLVSFMSGGKNVIIVPGENLSPNLFNRQFKTLTGHDYLLDFVDSGNEQRFFSLSDKIKNDPLFRPVFSARTLSPDMPKIFKYFRLNSAGEPLMQFSSKQPFLSRFSSKQQKGALYLFAAQFREDWTDFQLKGIFIPMLYRLLFSAGSSDDTQTSISPDEPFSFRLASTDLQNRYFIEPPGGSPFEIIPEQASGGLYFNFGRLADPGHYKLLAERDHLKTFSVNQSVAELQQPFINFEELKNNVVRLDSRADFGDRIIKARSGQELWYVFLSLAVIMLLLEMILIKRIEGKY